MMVIQWSEEKSLLLPSVSSAPQGTPHFYADDMLFVPSNCSICSFFPLFFLVGFARQTACVIQLEGDSKKKLQFLIALLDTKQGDKDFFGWNDAVLNW